jgi:hypothetical protein
MRVPSPQEVEARVLALLAENDLPLPDRVEHEPGEVWCFWDERKVAIVVELAG